MTLRVIHSPYGQPAFEQLCSLISEHKKHDPLSPVTVVVPRWIVAVATRRQLGGLNNGIAAVTFCTLSEIAERLAAPTTTQQSRKPLSTAVLGAAVRTVLSDHDGLFRNCANHPATEQALVRAYRDLRDMPDAARKKLAAQSRRASDVVHICEQVAGKLNQHYFDEHDLHVMATECLQDGLPGGTQTPRSKTPAAWFTECLQDGLPGGTAVNGACGDKGRGKTVPTDLFTEHVLHELGAMVVYLPQSLPRSQGQLIAALAEHAEVTLLAGLTGNRDADGAVVETIERCGGTSPDGALNTPKSLPHGHRIISTANTDEEANAAVDEVLRVVRQGTPLNQIAVLCGGRSYPAIRRLQTQLDDAEVQYNGPSGRTLADSLAGRHTTALLEVGERDFKRSDVLAFISTLPPVLPDGTEIPTAEWERTTRDAGVARGTQQWNTQLTRFANERRARAKELEIKPDDPEAATKHAQHLRQQATSAEALREFVGNLVNQVTDGHRQKSWRDWCSWLYDLLHHYLGTKSQREDWPQVEQDAASRIEELLDRLAGLGTIEKNPRPGAFHPTLIAELNQPTSLAGKFGQGVHTGSIGATTGVQLSKLIIIGMAEGTFPHSLSEDPLLPEGERKAAGSDLPPPTEQIHDMHRNLLVAMASANSTTLIYARGDTCGVAEQHPSRWLLDTATALAGEMVNSTTLERFATRGNADWFHHVASFSQRAATSDFPTTARDYRLRDLLARRKQSHFITEDPVLKRGLEMIVERASDGFTRFDGNLGECFHQEGMQTEFSPTSLQTWAECPMKYFFERVLRVQSTEQPEEQLEISALDKGSLVHQVLEDFLTEQMAGGTVPEPNESWHPKQRDRLQEIAQARFKELEEKGLTGMPVQWRHTRIQIRADLERFLAHDDAWRAKHKTTPVASELTFGTGSQPESQEGAMVGMELSDGCRVNFRGLIDRVDSANATATGKLFDYFVTDYKTGNRSGFTSIDKPENRPAKKNWDPVAQGTKLQLPVYALAAQELYRQQTAGTQELGIRAEYRFLASGEGEPVGYRVTDKVKERFCDVVDIITSGISAGVFCDRPRPGSNWDRYGGGCEYCNADGHSVAEQRQAWERKNGQPELVDYRLLAEPEPEPEASPQPDEAAAKSPAPGTQQPGGPKS